MASTSTHPAFDDADADDPTTTEGLLSCSRASSGNAEDALSVESPSLEEGTERGIDIAYDRALLTKDRQE